VVVTTTTQTIDGFTVTRGDPPAIEWWRALAWTPRGLEQLHFVDPATAEVYARFLLDEGASFTLLEHWREGHRLGVRLIAAPPGS
jgi:hypothetical protein